MNTSRNIIITVPKLPEKQKKGHWYEMWKDTQQKTKKENMIIDITISLPKATPKPKRKVRVFNNFVKVGWNQYSIKIDPFNGYEYVKIDGKRYEIARDVFHQGVLVEI